MPRLLHPAVRTFESEQDGRYCFEVEAHLPLSACWCATAAGCGRS